MFHRISHFRRVIQQHWLSAWTAPAKQQKVRERDKSTRPIVSSIDQDLSETDTVPAMPISARKPPIEPSRTIVRRKPPMERYRELDALLEQMKRDRLNETETQLVLPSARELVLRLQRMLEQE